MTENIAETNSTESEEIIAEDNSGEQQLIKNDDAESCEEDYPLNPESTDLTELIDICLYKVFSKDASRSLPRKFYVEKLKNYISKMYEYNEFLVDKFYQLFNSEIKEAILANERERPMNLRVNSLETTKKELVETLKRKKVDFLPTDKAARNSLTVKSSPVPLGATPEYLSGKYTIQGLASVFPVLSLDIEPGMRILDMCAAPGGKTSLISELLNNTGIVIANEVREDRLRSIFGNTHRLGCKNVIINQDDGRNVINYMKNFDRVLIDAPCSGTGVIYKDPSVKSSKNTHNINLNSELQKELLLSAIDCCKEDGIIVYSTCSVLPMENEVVIDYVKQKRSIKILSTGLNIGHEGLGNFRGLKFHPDVRHSRRFYPHSTNTDGFFLCKIKKLNQKSMMASNVTLNFVVSNKQRKPKKSKKQASKAKKEMVKKIREKDYEKAIRKERENKKIASK